MVKPIVHDPMFLGQKSEDASMNDLLAMLGKYDASSLAEKLAQAAVSDAPKKTIFYDGKEVDFEAYKNAYANLIRTTGLSGEVCPMYAVASREAIIRSYPTTSYVGYSELDTDDEFALSKIQVNEPVVIKQRCVIGNQVFYYAYSNNCNGWIDSADLAVCASRNEWLDAWQTSLTGNDFVVVTQSKIVLDESRLAPATSGLTMTLGTCLKLVPKRDIPRNIGGRGSWNNYVVYIPARNADGSYSKQMALIPQHQGVNVGYLPMTVTNITNLALSCLGDSYGWGGTNHMMDCSLYTRTIYKCFGLEIPRNTTGQRRVVGTDANISAMSVGQKASTIASLTPGTLMYFPGHAVMYLGTVNGVSYVISDVGGVSDSAGYTDVVNQYSVAITPLTVRRRNQTTWLENITDLVIPWCIK